RSRGDFPYCRCFCSWCSCWASGRRHGPVGRRFTRPTMRPRLACQPAPPVSPPPGVTALRSADTARPSPVPRGIPAGARCFLVTERFILAPRAVPGDGCSFLFSPHRPVIVRGGSPQGVCSMSRQRRRVVLETMEDRLVPTVYLPTDLVSDQPGVARVLDPN